MTQHSKRIRQLFVWVVVLGSVMYGMVFQLSFLTIAPTKTSSTVEVGILPNRVHDEQPSNIATSFDVSSHGNNRTKSIRQSTNTVVDATKRNHETDDDDDDVTICFLVSVYGKWASHADQLQNVEKLQQTFFPFNDTISITTSTTFGTKNHSQHASNNFTDKVHFLVFTNMPGLKATGWTKIVRPYPQYQRYITQSRHPKFLGWNDTAVTERNCQVVFYQDAIGHIIGNYSYFQQTAKAILASDVGHAQYLHRGGNGAYGEFRRIEVFQKDSLENIHKSKAWLEAQPDFRPYNCTLYENRYIGYATQSESFRKASLFLWQRYSQELDSFRDQPLWCYTLDHFNITPIPLDHKQLWKLKTRRMGKHGHKYADLPSVDMGPKPTTVGVQNESSTTKNNN